MTDTNTAFGQWLRATRSKAGLSQQKVADAMQAAAFTTFRQTKVLKIEQATTAIFLDEAAALAQLFGTTLDVVLGLRAGVPSLASQDAVRRASLLAQIRDQIDAELGGAS